MQYLFLLFLLCNSCLGNKYIQVEEETENLRLNCSKTDDIFWYKDGRSLTSTNDGRIVVSSNGWAEIKNLQDSDMGLYECEDNSGTKERIILCKISLEPEVKILIGESVTLTCDVVGPVPIIAWYKDDSYFSGDNDRISVDKGIIKIDNATITDTAEYTCDISYDESVRFKPSSKLIVEEQPKGNGLAIGLGVTFGLIGLIALIFAGIYLYKNNYLRS